MVGIYKITNLINMKFYIGLSNDIERRFMEHKTPRNIIGKTTTLTKAFRKYGLENFRFEILEECKIEELAEREVYYIAKLKPQYNMNEGGKGNPGHKLSKELKAKLSQKAKEQWNAKSEDDKKFIKKVCLTGRKLGYMMSEETKEKLRKANLGKTQSIETKIKRSESNKQSLKGNKNGNKRVVCIDKVTLEVVKEFESLKQASEFYGIHPSCITGVLKGRRKTTCGYYWKYKKDL